MRLVSLKVISEEGEVRRPLFFRLRRPYRRRHLLHWWIANFQLPTKIVLNPAECGSRVRTLEAEGYPTTSCSLGSPPDEPPAFLERCR